MRAGSWERLGLEFSIEQASAVAVIRLGALQRRFASPGLMKVNMPEGCRREFGGRVDCVIDFSQEPGDTIALPPIRQSDVLRFGLPIAGSSVI